MCRCSEKGADISDFLTEADIWIFRYTMKNDQTIKKCPHSKYNNVQGAIKDFKERKWWLNDASDSLKHSVNVFPLVSKLKSHRNNGIWLAG